MSDITIIAVNINGKPVEVPEDKVNFEFEFGITAIETNRTNAEAEYILNEYLRGE